MQIHEGFRSGSRSAGVVLVTALVVGLMAPVGVGGQEFPADTVSVIKADEAPSNAEIAVRLSEETPLPAVDTVLIGRDDRFADSLASGVLQGASPLLLVPTDGPVPDRVRAELSRVSPTRVILLGGEAALTPRVADELAALGYAVERRAGASRFETAVAIARTDAAGADTVILARAFPSEGATDPTQGFADALAAGGMAAQFGWPVLLTQTDELSVPTRQYLVEAGIARVEIMGGTAAISAGVEAELQAMGIVTDRVAGSNRAETAIAVAEKLGADSAADAAHVIVVQGQTEDAWAGGFAAAARSALLGAPIVLAAGDQLPEATREWLRDGVRGGMQSFQVDPAEGPVLTCVVVPSLCEDARIALGLPPSGVAPAPDLVSVGVDGTNAGGTDAAVDASGDVVAFVSDGEVVPGVGDGRRHVYVTRYGADGTSTTEVVDVRPDGSLANDGISFSDGPLDVSGDGRYVAFVSPDDDLDSAGADGSGGFLTAGYLRDLQTGTTRLVALDLDGQEAADRPAHLTVSDDGTVVAYSARISGAPSLFVHDLRTGQVEPVRLPDGTPFTGLRGTPALSGDGSTVAFYTDLALIEEDTNDATDTYVYDIATRQLERVSVSSDGEQADTDDFNADGRLGLSRDGSLVVFASDASNLAPDAALSFGRGIYLHDRTTATTTLLSRHADGTAAGDARAPTISHDGRYAAFAAGGDLTGSGQHGCGIYRVTLATGALQRLDLDPLQRANNCPGRIRLADTGVLVADPFSSFTEADTDTQPDVYRWTGPAD